MLLPIPVLKLLAVAAAVAAGPTQSRAPGVRLEVESSPAAVPPSGKTECTYDKGANKVPFLTPLIDPTTASVDLAVAFADTLTIGELMPGGWQPGNFYPNLLMDVYVFPHRTWFQGDSLTERAVHRSLVRSDKDGALPLTRLWRADRAGVFDVIIDRDNDGQFSYGLDAIDAFKVSATPRPEPAPPRPPTPMGDPAPSPAPFPVAGPVSWPAPAPAVTPCFCPPVVVWVGAAPAPRCGHRRWLRR